MAKPAEDVGKGARPATIETKTTTSTASQSENKNVPSNSALKGASVLFGSQLGSRVITFTANQFIIRYMNAELLGLANQLEVYYMSILFFARESLRIAIQRQARLNAGSNSTRPANQQAIVNLGYLAVLLGSLITAAFAGTHLFVSGDGSSAVAGEQNHYYSSALYMYYLAAMVELLSEPIFTLTQMRLQMGVRATAESTATIARCFLVLGSLYYTKRIGISYGVLPFACGQLCYALVLLLIYVSAGWRLASDNGHSLLPRKIQPGSVNDTKSEDFTLSYFYRPAITLASGMMTQTIFKHILTQGDTFIISALSSKQSQGVYALANNYGGLASRLAFQPIEETSRAYFSNLLSTSTPSKPSDEEPADKKHDDDGQKRQQQQQQVGPSKETTAKAAKQLTTLLRTYVVLCSIIVSIGPVAAPPALHLIAGRHWAAEGAGAVLSVYCYYVPLLALNGVSEAFVASVATTEEVHRQTVWMFFFSAAFAGASFVTLQVLELGARGLVYANCLNMFCRIVWSLSFVRGYFARHGVDAGLSSLQPSVVTASVVLVAPGVIRAVTGVTDLSTGGVVDVAKVAVVGLPFCITILIAERGFIKSVIQQIRQQQAGQNTSS